MKQLKDYHLLDANPFVIKEDRSIERLAKNIERLPKMLELRPIVVDKDNRIVAGNKRFQALQFLEYKEVPDEWIKAVQDYTEDELKELIVLDNVTEGKWDIDILIEKYPKIELKSIGIDLEPYPDIDFIPNYNPEQGDNFVDADTISTTADRLAGAMSGQQGFVTLTCPHCLEEFDISK